MYQKKLIIPICLLVLIGGIALVFAWMQFKGGQPQGTSTLTESSGPARDKTVFPNYPVNLLTVPANGEWEGRKTIENRVCGVLFTIPSDWMINEYLGVSKVISPEDVRENEAWAAANHDLIEQSQGDVVPGPDKHRFIISCAEDVAMYLNQDLGDTARLADVLATRGSLVRTMGIDGWTAYETVRTHTQTDGTELKFYTIAIELNRPHMNVVTIDLGETEYMELSPEVKQTIDYLSFNL